MTQEMDPSVQEFYPDLSPEQQEEVQFSFQRYIELMSQIYEKLETKGVVKIELNKPHLREEWEKRDKNSTNH